MTIKVLFLILLFILQHTGEASLENSLHSRSCADINIWLSTPLLIRFPNVIFSGTNGVCGAALAQRDAQKTQGAVQGSWGHRSLVICAPTLPSRVRDFGAQICVGSGHSSRSCLAWCGLQAANASDVETCKNVSTHTIRNSSLSSWRKST